MSIDNKVDGCAEGLGYLIAIAVVMSICPLIFMWAWNMVAADVFGAPRFGFWTSVAATTLLWFVTRPFARSKSGGSS